VAVVYGLLMVAHVVFGLFFALAITSSVRAAWLWSRARRPVTVPASGTVLAGERAAAILPGGGAVAARADPRTSAPDAAQGPVQHPAQPAAPRAVTPRG
jgi:hypothetical protein